MTKVSILAPCFNHEKYIKSYIESVLNQTCQDFEVIIVDDCSTDNSVCEIEKFVYSKIKLIKHEFNKGINAALNTAFKAASGEIVTYGATDDILKENYIKDIIKQFDQNPDKNVIYTPLSVIDEKGKSTSKIINIKYKNRFEILKKIFFDYNPLTSPGMAVRKEAFEKLYPLDSSIINQQDCQMHVKLLLNNEICIVEQPLFNYRIPNQNTGISKRSADTKNREDLELKFILDEFLKIDDVEILKNIFQQEINNIGEPDNQVIPYFLGRFALSASNDKRKRWGYQTIVEFLRTDDNFKLLNNKYNFNFKELLSFIKNFEETDEMKSEKKVKKYKKLFNSTLCISLTVIIFLIICIFLI